MFGLFYYRNVKFKYFLYNKGFSFKIRYEPDIILKKQYKCAVYKSKFFVLYTDIPLTLRQLIT